MNEQAPQVDVQAAFDPELRKAQADLNLYMENRPYQDSKGNVHDPANGNFVNADKYFDGQRKIAEEAGQESYEDMSMPALARKLAEAEHHEDKTSAQNITDVLEGKLLAHSEKHSSERDSEHNAERDENLLNRIIGIKDKELARLKEVEAGHIQNVRYQPRRDGKVQLGIEVEDEGIDVPLNNPDNLAILSPEHRKVILYDAEGNEYYVRGNALHYFTKDGADMKYAGSMDAEGELNAAKTGSEWTLPDGSKTIRPIAGVEIAADVIEADQEAPGFEANGVDPFDRAEALLEAAMAEEAAEAEDHTGEVEQVDDAEVVDSEPMTLRQRMAWAARRLRELPTAIAVRTSNGLGRSREYFGDEEHGRRRRIIGVVLGAAAVGGAAYLAAKGFDGGHHAKEVSGNGAHPVNPVNHLPATPKAPSSEHLDHVKSVHLSKGDTIWHEAQSQLERRGNAHPSNAQILERTQHILNINHLNWEQARHLAEGTEIEL